MRSWLVFVLVLTSLDLAFNEELNEITSVKIPTSLSELDVSTESIDNEVSSNSGKDIEIAIKKTENEVEEFIKTLTTSSPVRTFKDEEKAMLDYVNSLMRQILPHIMNSASTKLSVRCMSALMKSFAGIRKLKGWTLKLLDSSGKLSPGILTGRSYSMGDYDQCLDISVNNKGQEAKPDDEEMFRGKYCVVRLQQHHTITDAAKDYHTGKLNASSLGKLKEMIEAVPYIPLSGDYMSHFVGLCIPSLCSDDDIKGIVQTLPFPGTSNLESCESKQEEKFNSEQRAFMIIFIFLLTLVIIGTAMDKLLQLLSSHCKEQLTGKKCINLVLSFSLLFNTRKLLQRIQNDQIETPNWKVVRGLFVYTIMLQIIYHTYIPPFQTLYRQIGYLGNIEKYAASNYFSFIICLPLTMETLFFLYGLTLTNRIWKTTYKNKTVRVRYLKVLVESYCQLCIPLLFCYSIITVLPIGGSGPLWKTLYSEISKCNHTAWWRIIGMYNNFLTNEDECLPYFWFVPCLMQLMLVGLVMMFFLAKWRKFGIFLMMCGIGGCNIAVGTETYKKKLPPAYLYYFSEKWSDTQWLIQESSPLIHFTAFAVGMLMGIFMARKATFELKKGFLILGWLTTLCFLGLCMPFVSEFTDKEFADNSASAAYAPLQKALFVFAITWVTFIAAYGTSGFVRSFLCWSVLDPLYKLSYFAYLLHFIVIACHSGTSREHFHYTHCQLMFRAVSYVVLTYVAAYVSSMLTTMPLKSLYTVVFASKFKQTNMMINSTAASNSGFKPNSLDMPFSIQERGYFNKF